MDIPKDELNKIKLKYAPLFEYMDRQQALKNKKMDDLKRDIDEECKEPWAENLEITRLLRQLIVEFDGYRVMLFDRTDQLNKMKDEIISLIEGEDFKEDEYSDYEKPEPDTETKRDVILDDQEDTDYFRDTSPDTDLERLNEIRLYLEQTGGPISIVKQHELAKKYKVDINQIEDDIETVMAQEMERNNEGD